MSKGFQDDGLTPQQERFAALVAQGVSQSDAYREVADVEPDTKPESIWQSASKVAADPKVRSRIRELTEGLQLADIISVQAWFQRVAEDTELARAKGNMTAAMSGHRIIGQALQALRDGVNVNVGNEISDDALILRLTNGDPDKTKMLKAIVGKDDFTRA